MAAKKANYHVVPKGDDWAVKKAGNDRASGRFDTQREAEAAAKGLARNQPGGGEVRIHGTDGKIRDSDTIAPANDPNPPKDKVH